MAQWLTNPTRNHEVVGSIPALAQWVRIWHCRELWCRLQTRLGSHVAVALAQASGYSSDLTPSLRTSICRGSGPRNSNNNNKNKRQKKKLTQSISSLFSVFLKFKAQSLMISLTYNHKMIITINLVNIYHSYRYKIKEIEKKSLINC